MPMNYTGEMDLRDLNPQQLAAVNHGQGPALVVAGAGTGKTRVITYRIANLIGTGQAKPEEILALTFTEKAAGEMLDRLDGLIGWQAHRVSVMTFHAFGGQLLQRYGHHGGYSTRGEIIPDIAKLILLKQKLNQIKLSYYGPQQDIIDFLQQQLDYIHVLQNADISVDDYSAYIERLDQEKVNHPLDLAEARDRLALYRLYEHLKQEQGVIDYHDQIALPLRLLEEKPNLVKRLRDQYRFVLVDEYQDTNGAQDALLRSFIPPDGNIFAVGDDDQAIYGFRGARLSNILQFAEHYKIGKPFVLTQNFRSTQEILDAAYAMIKNNNPDRLEAKLGIDKHLKGQGEGIRPLFKGYEESSSEYKSITAELEERITSGQQAENIAVLATGHATLRNIARVMQAEGVPYRLSSTVNIFEQPEVRQLWYLCKWIMLGADDETVTNLLLGPFFGWTPTQVREIAELSRKELQSMEAVLLAAKNKPQAKTAISNLMAWREWAKESGVSHFIYRLVFETGISRRWITEAENTPRMVKVFEDLQLWLKHSQQYEHVALDPTVAGYMASFPKPPEIESDEVTGDEHGVALLTIHASKGLEFETVYIINNTETAWSHSATGRKVELPSELKSNDIDLPPEHERRRLLYVAMTRAKSELIISAPHYQSGGRVRKLNPLLKEVFTNEDLRPPLEVEKQDRLNKTLNKLHQFSSRIEQWSPERLPFETPEGWLELSVTDLDKYQRCPYEFYLEKVLKIRTPVGPQIQFGSLLHSLFNEYYLSRLSGEELQLSELLQRLSQRWSNHGYRTVEESEIDFQRAQVTLNSFYTREQKSNRKLLFSEEKFSLSIPEAKLKLRGKIDAAFEIEEGVEVRDFKTGRKRDEDKLSEEAKKSLQLRTYSLALQEMTGRAPARVVLDYIVSGVEGVAELSPRILANHRMKLAEISDKIRNCQFEPSSDMFHECAAYKYWGTGESDA